MCARSVLPVSMSPCLGFDTGFLLVGGRLFGIVGACVYIHVGTLDLTLIVVGFGHQTVD